MTVVPPAMDHDLLLAGVANRIGAYASLSRNYAAAADSRLAVLAVWAADVAALQCLLWESGLGGSPDPDAQLRSVAEAVAGSLSAYAGDPRLVSPKQAVEDARAALTATFDPSVHALLSERLVPLDHLDGLEPPVVGTAEHVAGRRLDGRSVTGLIENLFVTATDCMAVADAMAAAGLEQDVLDQIRMADLAAFEAYLLQAALAVGDTTLATVDLRWDLAMSLIGDAVGDCSDIRDRLLEAVGPAEKPALEASFERCPHRAA